MLLLKLSGFLLLTNELAKIVRALLETRLQPINARLDNVANLVNIVLELVLLLALLSLVGTDNNEERVRLVATAAWALTRLPWPDMIYVAREEG